MNDDENIKSKKLEATEALRSSMMTTRASLTPGEAAFLRALLLDDNTPVTSLVKASRKLNDDMLFSLPFEEPEAVKHPSSNRHPRPNEIGLWSAFRDGVRPKALARKGSLILQKHGERAANRDEEEGQALREADDDSIASDEEVRPDHADDRSENSSFAEDDVPPENYDSWEVLRDEYAKDFGFDNTPIRNLTPEDLDEDDSNYFDILGTSADDKLAHPHVLSPPLMDSLMTFLPDAIKNQNYWLKYSLIRDGSSLGILRRYVRGAKRTILAIETTDGQVFGSFTSTNWRYERNGFYGTGESFLWRMRHSRKMKCASLYDQAQLESEIDVYFKTNKNDMFQMSTNDLMAIGGGEMESDTDSSTENRFNRFGFGISIDDMMQNGTSSPCATYHNPCLVDGGPNDKRFKIANVEVWTLTPCMTVDAAERLEMSQFWIHESTRDMMTMRSAPPTPQLSRGPSKRTNVRTASEWDGNDLTQESFYRRVGQNDENEQQRDLWQYATMMNATK